MEANPIKNIQECFSTLTDPRVDRGKRHQLMDILIIAISAVICEADTWEDMAEFGGLNMNGSRAFSNYRMAFLPMIPLIESLLYSTRWNLSAVFYSGQMVYDRLLEIT